MSSKVSWLLVAASLGLATGVTLAERHLDTPRSKPSSKAWDVRLDLSHSATAGEPGCNSTAFAQVPNQPTIFIGRQQITADGLLAGLTGDNDCSGGDPGNERRAKPFNRWALVLDSFDWETRQFTIIKPLVDTSLDPRTGISRAAVTGGPMRGLIIRSAYDPSAVEFKGKVIVAFECTAENGTGYGIRETSSCVGVYDPQSRSIDMRTVTVAVSGERRGESYEVASVPRLLVFEGKLYLYWAASTIQAGKIVRSAARGAELQLRNGIALVRGAGNRIVTPLDDASTEVWSTEGSPSTNLIANIMSLTVFPDRPDSFLVLAVLGGGDCQTPAGRSSGCFRLAIARSSAPVQARGFNSAPRQWKGLPSNPVEYPTLVRDRKGQWWLLGHFRRPRANGSSERQAIPGRRFSDANQRDSILALVPAHMLAQ
jgi:hypothetical protein